MTVRTYSYYTLKQELTLDEGRRLDIYKDSLGYLTVGIGHLILRSDLEYGKPVGHEITNSRCDDLFKQDVATAKKDAAKLVDKFGQLPNNIQRVLINMTFNLGYTKLTKWVQMRRAINHNDWPLMQASMRNSLWYRQVGKRADRLIKLVQDVIDDDKRKAGQQF